MSSKPIVRNPSVSRLIEEGFEIEITHQHLLVHSIPYLNKELQLKKGTFACPYSEINGQDTRPDNHTMWFQGDHPYNANGQPMSHVVHNSNQRILFGEFVGNHYFSNKPNGQPFANFYDKVVHYHTLLVAQARVIDPNADGRTGVVHQQRDEQSVFMYPDTASSRAGITAITARLEATRVAIVGIGGTGSYILDFLSKTPVKEIHLFDGDDFEPHNAFRAPGAASFEQLREQPKKVDFFSRAYTPIRTGIISHPYHLYEDNIGKLEGFSFVFVAVDNGSARRIITEYLNQEQIPFIDVGMGIERVELDGDYSTLRAACRVTLATDRKRDHLAQRLDLDEDNADVLYRSNIQVVELNALNAALAVARWKQYMGFYLDQQEAHNLSFSLPLQSLSRDELPD